MEGSGWGASFSASAGYQKASAELSTGNYVYIISSAKCTYYYASLLELTPPEFSDSFIKWVKKLNGTGTTHVFDFIDLFGTHYLLNSDFGARYNREHRMDATTYTSQKSKGFDVSVAASYSGTASIGGGFSMDQSQRDMASEFSKMVTTTSSSVGATPPESGDANEWASTVKNSPLPVKYKFASIDKLFTDNYMSHLNVDHDAIRKNIKAQQPSYCPYLKKAGEVESCTLAGKKTLEMLNIELAYGTEKSGMGKSDCRTKCQNDTTCLAAILTVSKCYHLIHTTSAANCKRKSFFPTIGAKTYIMLENIKSSDHGIFLGKTKILGEELEKYGAGFSGTKCEAKCWANTKCIAYTYCATCAATTCWLYDKNYLYTFEADNTKTSVMMGTKSYVACTDQSLIIPNLRLGVSTGGYAGYCDWKGTWSNCEDGYYAAGVKAQVEGEQSWGADDSSLNAVELSCRKPSDDTVSKNSISHGSGKYGTWGNYKDCPSGYYVVAFKTQLEALSASDKSGVNKVMLLCRNDEGRTHTVVSDGTDWGTWGDWSTSCPLGSGVCSMDSCYDNYKMNAHNGNSDKVGLVTLNFRCCYIVEV